MVYQESEGYILYKYTDISLTLQFRSLKVPIILNPNYPSMVKKLIHSH